MLSSEEITKLALIGVGATALMDVWSFIQKALGSPTLDYAMVGRWVGHLFRGKLMHRSIANARPVQGEVALGWGIHYAAGIAFTAALAGIFGISWLHAPTWAPALIVGLITVVIPFFVMQPAMGAGIAASRTPMPWGNRLRSLLIHAVFGAGLYLCAVLVNWGWK